MKKLLLIGIILLSISSTYAQCDGYQSSMSDVQSYTDDAISAASDAQSYASSGESECE